MNHFSKLLTATALSAAFLLAQGPGTRFGSPPDPARMIERRVNMLANRLTLTDSQKSQATVIYTQAQTAGATIRTSIQPIFTSLSTAVKSNATATIDQLSAQLGTLTGQLTAIDRKADAAFYVILTPEQQAKFDDRGGPMDGHGRRGAFRQ
ncbi:MAG: Spy/CpxP family protein refolding chaperone [Bryobacteraceae bacterium]|nr:Spy/CpxP family protein refolding chaperone [Bryobacteraceae bacterium]